MFSIGQRIREVRKQKGMKQKELSEKIGVQYSYLSFVESDKRNINAYQLRKLCIELDVSADYILGLIPFNIKPTDTNTIIDRLTDEYERKIHDIKHKQLVKIDQIKAILNDKKESDS